MRDGERKRGAGRQLSLQTRERTRGAGGSSWAREKGLSPYPSHGRLNPIRVTGGSALSESREAQPLSESREAQPYPSHGRLSSIRVTGPIRVSGPYPSHGPLSESWASRKGFVSRLQHQLEHVGAVVVHRHRHLPRTHPHTTPPHTCAGNC